MVDRDTFVDVNGGDQLNAGYFNAMRAEVQSSIFVEEITPTSGSTADFTTVLDGDADRKYKIEGTAVTTGGSGNYNLNLRTNGATTVMTVNGFVNAGVDTGDVLLQMAAAGGAVKASFELSIPVAESGLGIRMATWDAVSLLGASATVQKVGIITTPTPATNITSLGVVLSSGTFASGSVFRLYKKFV